MRSRCAAKAFNKSIEFRLLHEKPPMPAGGLIQQLSLAREAGLCPKRSFLCDDNIFAGAFLGLLRVQALDPQTLMLGLEPRFMTRALAPRMAAALPRRIAAASARALTSLGPALGGVQRRPDAEQADRSGGRLVGAQPHERPRIEDLSLPFPGTHHGTPHGNFVTHFSIEASKNLPERCEVSFRIFCASGRGQKPKVGTMLLNHPARCIYRQDT